MFSDLVDPYFMLLTLRQKTIVTRNYNVTLCFYFTINAVRHGKFLCLPFSFTSREEPVSLGQVLLWKKAFFARATGILSLGFLFDANLTRPTHPYATHFYP